MSKSLTSRYSQKVPDHAKQCATDVLETTSKKVIQKTAEVTSEVISLIGNKSLIQLRKSQELHLRLVQRKIFKINSGISSKNMKSWLIMYQ